MEIDGKTVLLCNCEQTMPLDETKLAKACKAAGCEGKPALNTQLCRSQLANYQHALAAGKPVMVACTQEAPFFSEVAAEDDPEAALGFFNIRELAGWGEQGAKAYPKIAALIAMAAEETQATPTVSYESGGVCLVYGKDDQAIEIAKMLSDRLEVTVLLTPGAETEAPSVMDVPVFQGRITGAKGHLGTFAINVDGYAPASPSAREVIAFEAARNNAYSECDVILDLTGESPLFNEPDKRDGYLRADPGNPAAVMKAAFEASGLIGEFEKPRYVKYTADICAHSRSGQTGCTRCLDLCPTGAIAPAGDHVNIDPHVCAGCGYCASVCPTGAATYQYPPMEAVMGRLRRLLSAYHAAGGADAVLLLHDERHGRQAIDLMARHGRGLPARVLPFAVNEVTQVGIDILAAALAYGAGQIAILVGPDKKGELTGLAGQISLAETAMEGLGYGAGRVHVLDDPDPTAIEAALHDLPKPKPAPAGQFLPMGGKRTRTMLALRHLRDEAPEPRDILPLPTGAPFGAVKVDTTGCTMCLACVSACPTGALQDDPERPWLGFNEEACVQCGLCRNTCPENVITLEPRFNFTDEARQTQELNRAEPFHCVRCGKPFGVKNSIDRIIEQLAGKHWMFAGSDAAERIMMCEDCRVTVEFSTDRPMAGEAPRVPRTTEDYLREREAGLTNGETGEDEG